jgi:hypothetical protein
MPSQSGGGAEVQADLDIELRFCYDGRREKTGVFTCTMCAGGVDVLAEK